MIAQSRLPTLIIGGLVSLGVVAGLADAVRSAKHELVSEARPAPTFEGQTPDGVPVTLDQYAGKVVVIDFFASWCKPCEESMPTLLAAASALADQGVVVLAASCDEEAPDRDAQVRSFFNRINVVPPTIVYPTMATQGRYGITGFPTTVLIDRASQARRISSQSPPLQIRGALERALAVAPTADGG